MKDPHAPLRKAIEDSVWRGPGQADASLRQAVGGAGGEVPEELKALVEKIDRAPYEVTDEDIARLKSKYSEDEIYEIVISATIGASKRRLEAGLRALEEAIQ